MPLSIENFITPYKKSGRLAIAANLLFDLALVGWIAFTGLYALETLLPTFVIARLSLVKFAVILLLLTSLLVWISSVLGIKEKESATKKAVPRIMLVAIITAGVGIIALTHYHFPWWSIPIMLGGYALALWFFIHENRMGPNAR